MFGEDNRRFVGHTPHFLLRWLLHLEGVLSSIHGDQRASPILLGCRLIISLSILMYHSLMVLAFQTIDDISGDRGAVIFSMICDFFTIVTILSMLSCSSLTILLGYDADVIRETSVNRRDVRSILRSVAVPAIRINDASTWYLALGSVTACIANEIGEVLIFQSSIASSQDTASTISLIGASYLMGCTMNNIVLTLGSGYSALAQNLFAVQLQTLAHTLHPDTASSCGGHNGPNPAINEVETSGVELTTIHQSSEIEDVVDEPETLFLPSSTINNVLSNHMQETWPDCTYVSGISPDTLAQVYFELRRRQERLSRSLHRRIGLVFLSLTAETIVMVTQGYGNRQQDFSNLQSIGVLCTFIGNAFALWSLVFSTGRVMYVSREELGYAATKWAIRQSSPGDSTAIATAQMIKAFPMKFHVGIFEWNEDVARGTIILLMALASSFDGANLLELQGSIL